MLTREPQVAFRAIVRTLLTLEIKFRPTYLTFRRRATSCPPSSQRRCPARSTEGNQHAYSRERGDGRGPARRPVAGDRHHPDPLRHGGAYAVRLSGRRAGCPSRPGKPWRLSHVWGASAVAKGAPAARSCVRPSPQMPNCRNSRSSDHLHDHRRSIASGGKETPDIARRPLTESGLLYSH